MKPLPLPVAQIRLLPNATQIWVPCEVEIPDDADEVFYWEPPKDIVEQFKCAPPGLWVRQHDSVCGWLKCFCVAPYAPGDKCFAAEQFAWLVGERDPSGRDDDCLFYSADKTSRYFNHFTHAFVEASDFYDQAVIDCLCDGFLPPEEMPEWASRYGFEITAVGAKRVADISHEGAIACGCEGFNWVASSPYIAGPHTDDGELPDEEFRRVWTASYPQHPFESAWAWVLDVKPIEGNSND